MKHWRDAAPLHTPNDGVNNQCSIVEVLADDSSKIWVKGDMPICTDMLLAMEDVCVVSTSFVGDCLAQTEEDVHLMLQEDWEAQGRICALGWLVHGIDRQWWHVVVHTFSRLCHLILTCSDELIATLGGCPMDDN